MSNRHFVIVTLDTKANGRSRDLQGTLNRAADWIEIKPDTWLLWTGVSAKSWYFRFKPQLQDGERLFACRIDHVDRGGLMPGAFWDFVKGKVGGD